MELKEQDTGLTRNSKANIEERNALPLWNTARSNTNLINVAMVHNWGYLLVNSVSEMLSQ